VIIVGTATTILGLWLALNVFGSADKLAASARTMPWWRKGSPTADYAVGWRVSGLAFTILGLGLIIAGLGFHPRDTAMRRAGMT
jgi:hypothetical protein